MDFQTFQKIVSDHKNKLKQVHIVLLCLNYVEEFPELASTIGCLWDSYSTFLINTAIFASFIGRKSNTINRYFRYHNFTKKKSSKEIRQKVPPKFNMDKLPDQTNWMQRSSKGFNQKTTEIEAIHWKFFDYKNSKPVKPVIDVVPIEPSPKKDINTDIFENDLFIFNYSENLNNPTDDKNDQDESSSIVDNDHDSFFQCIDDDNFNIHGFDDNYDNNNDIFSFNDGLF